MKVSLYNQKGNKIKKNVELADSIFGAEYNSDLIAQALYVFQSNQRLGTQKTKGISEVSGGGRKPWRQKTPDKARHGSTRSPIWVGGGDAHPIFPRNWRLRINKKMKRGAIFSALSYKQTNSSVKVVDRIELSEKQLTKQVEQLFQALGEGKKLLFVTKEKEENLLLGAKGLDKVSVVMASELNLYDILNADIIVFLEDAVDKINDIWTDKTEVETTVENKEQSK